MLLSLCCHLLLSLDWAYSSGHRATSSSLWPFPRLLLPRGGGVGRWRGEEVGGQTLRSLQIISLSPCSVPSCHYHIMWLHYLTGEARPHLDGRPLQPHHRGLLTSAVQNKATPPSAGLIRSLLLLLTPHQRLTLVLVLSFLFHCLPSDLPSFCCISSWPVAIPRRIVSSPAARLTCWPAVSNHYLSKCVVSVRWFYCSSLTSPQPVVINTSVSRLIFMIPLQAASCRAAKENRHWETLSWADISRCWLFSCFVFLLQLTYPLPPPTWLGAAR